MPTETVCPDCGGSGWKIIERADLSGAQRCDCVFGERARRLEENAAIPPLYRNASFDNFVLPRDNPIGHRELANVLLTVIAFLPGAVFTVKAAWPAHGAEASAGALSTANPSGN